DPLGLVHDADELEAEDEVAVRLDGEVLQHGAAEALLALVDLLVERRQVDLQDLVVEQAGRGGGEHLVALLEHHLDILEGLADEGWLVLTEEVKEAHRGCDARGGKKSI